MRLDQAKRLKALEQENTRLKRLVADQALDNMILKGGGLGETAEPVPAPPGRGAGTAPAGRLGAAGLPSAQSGAVDTPASAGRPGRRTPAGRAPHRVGNAVWAVWTIGASPGSCAGKAGR